MRTGSGGRRGAGRSGAADPPKNGGAAGQHTGAGAAPGTGKTVRALSRVCRPGRSCRRRRGRRNRAPRCAPRRPAAGRPRWEGRRGVDRCLLRSCFLRPTRSIRRRPRPVQWQEEGCRERPEGRRGGRGVSRVRRRQRRASTPRPRAHRGTTRRGTPPVRCCASRQSWWPCPGRDGRREPRCVRPRPLPGRMAAPGHRDRQARQGSTVRRARPACPARRVRAGPPARPGSRVRRARPACPARRERLRVCPARPSRPAYLALRKTRGRAGRRRGSPAEHRGRRRRVQRRRPARRVQRRRPARRGQRRRPARRVQRRGPARRVAPRPKEVAPVPRQQQRLRPGTPTWSVPALRDRHVRRIVRRGRPARSRRRRPAGPSSPPRGRCRESAAARAATGAGGHAGEMVGSRRTIFRFPSPLRRVSLTWSCLLRCPEAWQPLPGPGGRTSIRYPTFRFGSMACHISADSM